jgi:hypothetical protein
VAVPTAGDVQCSSSLHPSHHVSTTSPCFSPLLLPSPPLTAMDNLIVPLRALTNIWLASHACNLSNFPATHIREYGRESRRATFPPFVWRGLCMVPRRNSARIQDRPPKSSLDDTRHYRPPCRVEPSFITLVDNPNATIRNRQRPVGRHSQPCQVLLRDP